jgi:signal transduction histidine kinase
MSGGLRIGAAAILALLVGAFIVRNEIGARREARDQIRQHASVISEAVWTLDRDGARDYLQLAIQNGHYEKLLVTTSDGEPFYSGSGTPLDTSMDRLLGAAGLIPVVTLRADVTRGQAVIGAVAASARLKTIYADLYALVLGLLLFLAGRLYLDLLGANRDLDHKVQERTKQLAESYRRLGTVEEDERRLLHRELHDRIGANLSALRLELYVTEHLLAHDEKTAAMGHVEGASSVVKETISMARDLMAELRPPALDDHGLVAALRTFVRAQAERLGMSIGLQGSDLLRRPSPFAETALFRIVQEAVSNAAKYSSATHVDVSVLEQEDAVIVRVVDDGRGFDLSAVDRASAHWGLSNMRERAQAIGATLRVDTALGKGTSVTVELPRHEPEPAV